MLLKIHDCSFLLAKAWMKMCSEKSLKGLARLKTSGLWKIGTLERKRVCFFPHYNRCLGIILQHAHYPVIPVDQTDLGSISVDDHKFWLNRPVQLFSYWLIDHVKAILTVWLYGGWQKTFRSMQCPLSLWEKIIWDDTLAPGLDLVM